MSPERPMDTVRCLSVSFVFPRQRAQDFDGKWSAPELPMSPAMAFSALGGGKAPDAEVKAWTDEGWTDAEGPSVRGPESVDIPGESGIIDIKGSSRARSIEVLSSIDSIDDFLVDSLTLKEIDPNDLFLYLRENEFEIKPLGRGNYEGVFFEEGGGYRVNWGGDRILQYHPASRSHHDGAYYKISSGKTGTIRINLK